MTKVKAEFGELLINNLENERSECHIAIAQPTPLEEKNLGKVFVLLELQDQKAKIIAPELFNLIQEEITIAYYHASEFDVEVAFENALQKVNQKIKKFASENGDAWVKGLHTVLAVIKGTDIHFAVSGKSQAFLIQKNRIIDVMEENSNGDDANLLKIFSSILSGKLQAGDVIVFCTESILDYISKDKIRRLVQEMGPREVTNKLQNLLQENTASTNFACLLLKASAEDEVVQDNASEKQSISKPQKKLRVQDSMNSLIHTERATNELLTPSLWPNFKNMKSQKNTTIQKKETDKEQKNIEHVVQKHIDPEKFPTKKYLDIVWKYTKYISLKIGSLIVHVFHILSNVLRRKKGMKRHIRRLPHSAGGVLSRIVLWFKGLSNARKILLIIALVFIVLFAQSVMQQGEKKEEVVQTTEYETNISNAQTKIDEAKSALVYNNEEGAREFLMQAKELLDQIPTDVSYYAEKVQPKKQEVQERLGEVNHVQNYENPEMVADFSSISSDLNISQIQLNSENLVAFDNDDGSIYFTKLDSPESSTLISNPDAEKTILASAENEGKIYTLDTKFNLGSIDVETKSIKDIPFNADEENIKTFSIFSNKLYTLSPEKNQIYKHATGGSGYSASEAWVTEENNDLENAVSMFIDGSIYVLKKDGTILKFFSGKKDADFKQIAVDPQIQNAEKIVSTIDGDTLYVLDHANKRIITFTKDGKLVKQFTSERFTNAKDIKIDSEENFLYVLSNAQVYKIDLKSTNP